MKRNLSIVVPVYFNSRSLPELYERLARVTDDLAQDYQFQFVFVDDGSRDESFAVLEGLAERDGRVCIVRLSRNFGSNSAILAGLSCATGDGVIAISADLQDPPELIPELVRAWEQGTHVVMAARRKRNDPLVSRIFSAITNRLLRLLVFPEYPTKGFDFVCMDRRVVDLIVSSREMNAYVFGMAMWVGFKREIIYYDRNARQHGKSRWGISKKIKYFVDIFVAFSYLPLRIASIIGILLSFTGFSYALYVIAMKLFSTITIQGWTTLVVVVLISSGVQLILLGVLGEYMWRVLDESRNRPPYIVMETRNVNSAAPEYGPAWPRTSMRTKEQ